MLILLSIGTRKKKHTPKKRATKAIETTSKGKKDRGEEIKQKNTEPKRATKSKLALISSGKKDSSKEKKEKLITGKSVPVKPISLKDAVESLNQPKKLTKQAMVASKSETLNKQKTIEPAIPTPLPDVDFESLVPITDDDLSIVTSEKPVSNRITRSEIERQLDFQKEAMIHIDALYNFAVRMTGDPEDANDLVQETYMKAYRFFDSFEKGTNCKAWLFRILKNSYINKYRKESKEPDKVDYDDIKDFYHTVKHSSLDSNDMQEQMFGELLDDEVSRALQNLPDDFKEVVQLCDIEGFTYEEIANMVDCPIGTVRSRLHRGRKILREKLIDYAQQHGYKINPEEWD
ncbi:MAG: sigma-70 family RNA polymerase sigma factor [Chloroherpetonaceae bacterium]|nr:sigma-70 family RNA polymerase sigma factor [Chloroherpetonaceae bacterium]